MPSRLRWVTILIAVLASLGLLLCAPSAMWDYSKNVSRMPDWWRDAKVLPTRAVVLGLDLQGGMHLVISVNTDEAVKNELTQRKDSIKEYFKQEKIAADEVKLLPGNTISMTFADVASLDSAKSWISKFYGPDMIGTNPAPLTLLYTVSDRQAQDWRNNAVKQVMETLTSRIDEFGVSEPSIQMEGKDRIVLQLPGIKEEDRTRVLNIIQRTAKLEFMLVENVAASKEALLAPFGGVVPPGKRVLPGADSAANKGTSWYLLKEEPKASGTNLTNATMSMGGRNDMGGYMVDFEWNMEGARLFGKITGDNIGQHLAIVLEDKVKSAPVIQSKIFNRGQITGSFSMDEAKDLALVLRAGALPVSIKIEEERTVGPTLGKDLIRKGMTAAFISAAAAMIFMVLYYSMGGLVADLAVVLNMIFMMAGLAILRATLTLPGIAGIALMVAVAVDANVIIFERTREELRAGKKARSALQAGYDRSLWTILDAHFTALISSAILYQVGTGPIRGFAVTLSIGLVSSIFTSIVVTKTMYDLWFHFTGKAERLAIGIKVKPKEQF